MSDNAYGAVIFLAAILLIILFEGEPPLMEVLKHKLMECKK